MSERKLTGLVVLALCLTFASAAKAGSIYATGDVFLGVTDTGVVEYTPTGTYVQTINGGALGTFTTGMAFQDNGNLLVTNFSGGTVAQYDNAGNLLNSSFVSGLRAPESIAIDAAGHVYVSDTGSTGITKYNSTGGASIGTSIAGTRTDWIDLAADQKTMLYTDEGQIVHSVNVAANSSNPDFGSGGQFAIRIIPSGTFAGDVLAADSSTANLISADGTTILKSYTLPGNGGGDFALNLDGNGKDFWTADDITNTVWQVNIATGAIDKQWTATCDAQGSSCGTVFGLAVFGQKTASGGGGGSEGGGGTSVPEPGTITLLASGLLTLGCFAKRCLLT